VVGGKETRATARELSIGAGVATLQPVVLPIAQQSAQYLISSKKKSHADLF
jgi:hypothetical protein